MCQKNEPGEGVMEHKAAVSNPESESKNLEAIAKYCHDIFIHISNLVNSTVSIAAEILKQQSVFTAAMDKPAQVFCFPSLRTRMF